MEAKWGQTLTMDSSDSFCLEISAIICFIIVFYLGIILIQFLFRSMEIDILKSYCRQLGSK